MRRTGVRIMLWGLPWLAGAIWAGLWCLIFGLGSWMDAMEKAGETVATVLGRAVVFQVWGITWVAAWVLIPLVAWTLGKQAGGRGGRARRIGWALYGLSVPLTFGLGLLAWSSAFLTWAAGAWARWRDLDFALRQLGTIPWVLFFLARFRRHQASARQGTRPSPPT